MFLGHATLAFAIAIFVAGALGVDRDRLLALGVTAGLFATVPDVDMVYALVGLTATESGGVFAVTDSFWAASTLVHRAMTHSLVVAVPAAVAFVLGVGTRRERLASAGLLVALVAVSVLVSGWLGGLVMGIFGVAGLLVAHWTKRYDLDRRSMVAVALLGLASHPFGDVFTGEPPRFLYPLHTTTILDGHVTLHGDPTLHLLGAFAIELAAIWLGVLAYHHVMGDSIRANVNARATAGAAYALAFFVIPPPTLAVSYHFVFSVLAVGFVGSVPDPVRRRLPDRTSAFVTGLAAVTLAGLAYALAYVVGVSP